MIRLGIMSCALLTVLDIGCATTSQTSTATREEPTEPQQRVASNEPAPSTVEQSALSQGMITSRVKKGVTTQADLIDLFGGPNISTVDSEGNETWLYEVKTSSVSTQGKSSTTTRAEALSLFFGIGLASSGESQEETSSSRDVSYSMRNLTFIVKFNEDKTVKEYSVRQSAF